VTRAGLIDYVLLCSPQFPGGIAGAGEVKSKILIDGQQPPPELETK